MAPANVKDGVFRRVICFKFRSNRYQLDTIIIQSHDGNVIIQWSEPSRPDLLRELSRIRCMEVRQFSSCLGGSDRW